MSSTEPRIVEAEFAAAAASSASFPPPTGAEIAFAGRSNVGKSSLINRLTSRKNLVRVSATPGCTRAIGFYQARMSDGARITLVDLPGYGYARRSKQERELWSDLCESYLLGRPTLRAVVVIVDVRRGVEPDDRELLELLSSRPRVSRAALHVIVVATKLDKVVRTKQKLELTKVKTRAGLPVIGFSSADGTGQAELLRQLRSAADIG